MHSSLDSFEVASLFDTLADSDDVLFGLLRYLSCGQLCQVECVVGQSGAGFDLLASGSDCGHGLPLLLVGVEVQRTQPESLRHQRSFRPKSSLRWVRNLRHVFTRRKKTSKLALVDEGIRILFTLIPPMVLNESGLSEL